jgi:hypothetical protein
MIATSPGFCAQQAHLRCDAQQCFDDLRVELRARVRLDLRECLAHRPRMLVWSIVRECVEHIGHGNDASGERDAVARETEWIAEAVPALVVAQRNLFRELEQREPAARQDVGTDYRVRLDDVALPDIETTLLEQDRIRDADLADVVQRRSARDQLVRVSGEAQHLTDAACDAADAKCVAARLVVAELRSPRQAIQDLEPRFLELLGPLGDALLERRVVLPHLLVQESRLEQVANPQTDFGRTKWLRKEVAGSGGECSPARLGGVVARCDEDRQIRPGRQQFLDARDEVEAVQSAHPEVNNDQIRGQFPEAFECLDGVGQRDKLAVPLRIEDVLQELQIRRLVVYEQDARA